MAAKQPLVSLIINEFNGITIDLVRIFHYHSIQVYPKRLLENHYFTEKESLTRVENIMIDYENEISSMISESKLVIFIATNDSVESNACIELLQLSKKLKIPIVSLIVEEIRSLSEIKSTVLRDIDHHVEVFKDRVYADGSDPYMWLGECFQLFLKRLYHILDYEPKDISNEINEFYISYSHSFFKARSSNNVRDMIKLFTKAFTYRLKSKSPSFQVDTDENYATESILLDSKTRSTFDFDEYWFKRSTIDDDHLYDCLAIKKTFDNIVKTAYANFDDSIKNENYNKFPFRYRDHYSFEQAYAHRLIQNKTVIEFLKDELKKSDIEDDLLDRVLGYAFCAENGLIYEDFIKRKATIFLLTKEYCESKKFRKLYRAAKIMKKIVFLVKLEEFVFNRDVDDEYDQVYIHDISKHEYCNYRGYLTTRLFEDVSKHCGNTNDLKYDIWFDIFICSSDDIFTERIRNLKNIFIEKNIRVKYKIEIEENKDKIIEVYDHFQRSAVFIFCLTNEYLNSNEFLNELNAAKLSEKPVLFLLMEEVLVQNDALVDLSSFNVIEMYKHDPIFKGEHFYRLCYLVYSLLGFKQHLVTYGECEEVYLHPLDSKYECKNYSLYREGPLVKLGKIITSISIDILIISDIAYFKHLNSYCVLGKTHCYLYDDNFKFMREFTIHSDSDSVGATTYNRMLYDDNYGNVYFISENLIKMYDEKIQFKKELIMKISLKPIEIYKDHIYMTDEKKIIVLNLNLETVTKFGINESFIFCLKTAKKVFGEQKCDNYIYSPFSQNFKVFNINGFKYNECMSRKTFTFVEGTNANNTIFIDKAFSARHNSQICVYELKFNTFKSAINSNLNDYTCKLNTYPPHLLRHPYFLPCGALACLECIYENYNFYLNQFACVACNGKHEQLNNQLVEAYIIKDNLRTLSESQLKDLKRNIEESDFSSKIENLENRLRFLEEDIEIRVESLKALIDDYEAMQLKCIERLERKLLRNCIKNNTEFNDFDLHRLIQNCPYTEFRFSETIVGNKNTKYKHKIGSILNYEIP